MDLKLSDYKKQQRQKEIEALGQYVSYQGTISDTDVKLSKYQKEQREKELDAQRINAQYRATFSNDDMVVDAYRKQERESLLAMQKMQHQYTDGDWTIVTEQATGLLLENPAKQISPQAVKDQSSILTQTSMEFPTEDHKSTLSTSSPVDIGEVACMNNEQGERSSPSGPAQHPCHAAASESEDDAARKTDALIILDASECPTSVIF
jgi:hypothetical protein